MAIICPREAIPAASTGTAAWSSVKLSRRFAASHSRVAVRLRDQIGDDYSNEGMQYLKMRWGKMVADEVFVDTERIIAWESRHAEMTM